MITRKRKVGAKAPTLGLKSPQPSDNLSLTKEMRKSRQIKAKKVMSEEWKTDEPKKSPMNVKSRATRKKLVPNVTPSKSVTKKSEKGKQQTPTTKKVTAAKKPEMTPLKTPTRTQETELPPIASSRNLRKVNKTAQKLISPASKAVTKRQVKNKQLEQQSPKLQTVYKSPKKLQVSPLKQSKRITKKYSEQNSSENVDIYEFTYDPKEEPPPKKKKKTVRKKPKPKQTPQTKTYNYNNNYDKNVSKALSALKNAISTKTTKSNKKVTKTNELPIIKEVMVTSTPRQPQNCEPVNNNVQTINKNNNEISKLNKSPAVPPNYNSIRIEDIAADFEMSDNHDDLNYSPVYSPERIPSPNPRVSNENCPPPINSQDPLNLQGDLSFFNDQPVANSSMIKSTRTVAPSPRHPLASPWRVEFGSLPIKWQINTYIKPNMTPAVESSFIAENPKKHVYTNIVPTNDAPQIFEKSTSSLKQPSIISFIKEMAEKSAKKRGRSMSPIKANSLFEDSMKSQTNIYTSVTNNAVTPKKTSANVLSTPNKDVLSPLRTITNLNKENSDRKKDKENRTKTPKKQNKEKTFFGFDETNEMDQENVSPVKIIENRRLKALRPRSRAVLQEINSVSGPTRVALPAKSKIVPSSEAVNRMYDDLKSAEDAPVFLQKETPIDPVMTVVDENDSSNDGQSVHLFEDIDVVHHLKPHRKSYGKPKKVMFSQTMVTGIDQNSDGEHSASDIDDLADLNFSTAVIEEKKTKKKKVRNLRSKKEEKEANEWAAAFNSMCEDIDQFPLVVE